MAFSERLSGVELHGSNGTILRCLVTNTSDSLVFQVVVAGIRSFEVSIDPDSKKDLQPLLEVLIRWVGLDNVKKVLKEILAEEEKR
ncbi:MAG: hypothetical protein ACXQTW_05215 [Candidatus Methanospirareceae archaeon]